jgi:hypothetical protein
VQVAQKLGAHCLVECGTYASPALFVVISDDERHAINMNMAHDDFPGSGSSRAGRLRKKGEPFLHPSPGDEKRCAADTTARQTQSPPIIFV